MAITQISTTLELLDGCRMVMTDECDNSVKWVLSIHNGEIKITLHNAAAKKLHRTNKINILLNNEK